MDDSDPLDLVFKALADPTRRAILDVLKNGPQTTTELVEKFPALSRFGVMKHLDVLRAANLVQTRAEGRLRINSINVIPLQQMYQRWVSPYQAMWAASLTDLKQSLESDVK